MAETASERESLFTSIIFHCRTLLLPVILPLSVLYGLYLKLTRFQFTWGNTRYGASQHSSNVLDVQKQIQEWNKSGKTTRMCTARPVWQSISTRPSTFKSGYTQIKMNLKKIIQVDIENKRVFVEPLVTIGELTSKLLPLGWTIPIVPELEELTVGGLVIGAGIETSSHKYGLFQHICKSYELILPDGTLVKCSKEENSDLYYAVPWSYCTIGFLTAVELSLVPAAKYVRVDYYPANRQEKFVTKLNEESNNSENDFVEGIVFSKESGVVMTGLMVNAAPRSQINKIGLWYKPWFYKHVEKKLKEGQHVQEYIPLRDYYHRHTRSLFWVVPYVVPFGNCWLFRWLLGWTMPPNHVFTRLTDGLNRMCLKKYHIEDYLFPIKHLPNVIDQAHDIMKVYPQWVCPFKLTNAPGMVHPPDGVSEETYVDLGLYGSPKVENYYPEVHTRKMNDLMSKKNGYKTLYTNSSMTTEEFRDMFDHSLYDVVRKKFHCDEAFPEIYDKVSKDLRK